MTDLRNIPLDTPTLRDIDITVELERRNRRAPDYEAESRALVSLAREMAEKPAHLLQKLSEIALRLCRAGSTGVSLLERKNGRDTFRWGALAGGFAGFPEHTMPRDASPSGTTLDRGLPQLMRQPGRFFHELRKYPFIYEALLIPFDYHNAPAGTVWVVSHDRERTFDHEDERIVKSLAVFAAAGWRLWQTVEEQERLTGGLFVANETLQTKLELERAENGAQEDLIERLQVLEGEIKDFKAMLKKRRDR
ncbi:MAG TPA: hypothetical protein VKH64_15565 [Candidatus Binatia bacterium]|nr:hypothetical protein [Candidatus Binatia bacterium]